MISSPSLPISTSSFPFSRSTILHAVSGIGIPIESILLMPFIGLACVTGDASESPYPSTNLEPVTSTNRFLTLSISGAPPLIHALIELRSYFETLL